MRMSIKDKFNMGDGSPILRSRGKRNTAINAVISSGDVGISVSSLQNRLKLGSMDDAISAADWLIANGIAEAFKSDRKYGGRDVVKLRKAPGYAPEAAEDTQ